MGLDMYAYRAAQDAVASIDDHGVVELVEDSEGKTKAEQIAYWRKFNNLHGWMQGLYEGRGGQDSFNLIAINLTEEDLAKLEADAKNGVNLDPTEGFFFGEHRPIDKDDVEDILSFVAKGREVLASGDVLFYDSWW